MKNIIFMKHRERMGLSQVDLAKQVGVCKDYINMIENNRRRPGFALAKRIADLFGTTVDELFLINNRT